MSLCVKKHLNFLCLLCNTHAAQQQALIETANPEQVRAICECVYNILHGNIPVPDSTKEELKAHKQVLRDIADPKIPYKKKKDTLVQKGGAIWGAMLPLAINSVASLISKIV